MEHIQSIGLREFRANMAKYTGMEAPIEITSHGRAIGYYIPASPLPEQQQLSALKRAALQLESLLKERGISEDEIVADFQIIRNKKN